MFSTLLWLINARKVKNQLKCRQKWCWIAPPVWTWTLWKGTGAWPAVAPSRADRPLSGGKVFPLEVDFELGEHTANRLLCDKKWGCVTSSTACIPHIPPWAWRDTEAVKTPAKPQLPALEGRILPRSWAAQPCWVRAWRSLPEHKGPAMGAGCLGKSAGSIPGTWVHPGLGGSGVVREGSPKNCSPSTQVKQNPSWKANEQQELASS